jgi:signal transduction histidine kinase
MRSMRSLIQKSATPHEPYSLPYLINESIELIESQAKRQQVQIQLDSQLDGLMLDCDAVMLKQVLFNLMRNALEAMEMPVINRTEQVLQINVKQDELYVTISVIDQGTGIAEKDKLFQAFYTTKSEGMGLGLAICRTVIENHGGKIWAEDNLDGGATFQFRLPLTAQSTQSTPIIQTAEENRVSQNSSMSYTQVISNTMQTTSTVNL